MEKVRLNTNLDGVLKVRTEIIMKRLGIGWPDVISDAAMALIKKHDPKTYLETECRETEEIISSMKMSLLENENKMLRIKQELSNLKDLPEIGCYDDSEPIDRYSEDRESFFQKNKGTIIQSFNAGKLLNLNFDAMIVAGGFDKKKDAVAWTRQRVAQEAA